MKKFRQNGCFRVAAVLLTVCLLLSACGADGRAEQTPSGAAGGTGTENDNSDSVQKDNSASNKAGSSGMTVSNSTTAATGDKLYLQERQSIQFHEPESGYQTVNRFLMSWTIKSICSG